MKLRAIATAQAWMLLWAGVGRAEPPDNLVLETPVRTGAYGPGRGRLAGRAVALTACGLWVAPERSTDDTEAVTCRTCLKSFRYWSYGGRKRVSLLK